ncbi:MAG: hypothetical protein GXP31_06860 [Kiritimatiellaeota bacterium]|nr:hypothetical protein [Kiritimatiellota bacterium]
MNCLKFHSSTLRVLASALALGLILAAPARGAREKRKKEADWKVERRKLLTQIEQQVAAEVNKAVDPKKVAAQLKLKWPVTAPKKSLKEIEEEVKKRIQKMVDKEYPMEGKKEEYRKQAEAKYRLHKIGDRVSFVIRGGRGTNTFVEGRFDAITATRIKVSNRWIVRSDMAMSDVACFDPDVHNRYVERYARVQLNKYKIRRVDYAEALRKKFVDQAYKDAGYIKWGKNWIAARDLLDRAIAFQRKQLETRIRPKLEREVFTKKGYMLFKGEWMPKKTATSLKEKLKRMIEEKKQQSQAQELFGPEMGAGKQGGMPGMGKGADMMMGPGMPKGGGADMMMGPGMPGGKKKKGNKGGGLFDEDQ